MFDVNLISLEVVFGPLAIVHFIHFRISVGAPSCFQYLGLSVFSWVVGGLSLFLEGLPPFFFLLFRVYVVCHVLMI